MRDASALKGLNSSMATIPMLKIWTPPPDMYSMKACIGRDFAGDIARSHARFCFKLAYDAATSLADLVDVRDCE